MSPTEPSHHEAEQYEQLAEAITHKLRKVGLHTTRIQFANDPEDDQKYIVATMLIGDLAVSDRVQAPENLQMKDQFAEIEQDLLDQHIAEIQQEIKAKKEQADDDHQ